MLAGFGIALFRKAVRKGHGRTRVMSSIHEKWSQHVEGRAGPGPDAGDILLKSEGLQGIHG